MEEKFMGMYEKLLEKHGYQGWWPVTPAGGCSGEKHVSPIYGLKSKNEKQKLEIIFGTILTQNTSWSNAEKAIIELNKKDLIDINKIIRMPQESLAIIIKSSGYFNQKSRRLKEICLFLKEHSLEDLEKTDVRKARELLLCVPGIGQETADSILLYALNKPIFVVDNYTKKMLAGLGWISENAGYDEIQRLFMENLPKEPRLFNEFHALIIAESKH